MKKSITSLLKGWCAALLCAGLTLPSFAAADADAAFAAQRHDLKLSLHNAPLREVVTAFTQQTGVVFSYETSLGERTLPHVDVALNGSTLDEMLASVFAGTGISYKVKDKVVALSAPPQSDAPAARSAAQQRKQTVAGRVTDEQGEPLAGVSVLVKNTLTGTSTDADGRYSLSVSGSSAVLVFMYLGFQTLEEQVGARSALDVTLRENRHFLGRGCSLDLSKLHDMFQILQVVHVIIPRFHDIHPPSRRLWYCLRRDASDTRRGSIPYTV